MDIRQINRDLKWAPQRCNLGLIHMVIAHRSDVLLVLGHVIRCRLPFCH